uniref:Uncharacterized protein n=1 Tax=Rhizophora mucronata TaxID=61149 RepID=A0A2P2PEH8_RHIMU
MPPLLSFCFFVLVICVLFSNLYSFVFLLRV